MKACIPAPLVPPTRHAQQHEGGDSSSDSEDLTVQTPLLAISSSGLAPPVVAHPPKQPVSVLSANINEFDTFFKIGEESSTEPVEGTDIAHDLVNEP